MQAYAGIAAVAGELDVGDSMFSPPVIQGNRGRGGGGGGGNGLLSPPLIRRSAATGIHGRGGEGGFLSPPSSRPSAATGVQGRGGGVGGYPEVTPLRPPRNTSLHGAQRFNEYEGTQRAAVRVPVQAGCRYCQRRHHRGQAKAWCLHIHAEASLSLSLPFSCYVNNAQFEFSCHELHGIP